VKLRIETLDPNLLLLNSDRLEPNLEYDLSEITLPRDSESSNDKVDPNLSIELTLQLEPNRITFLIETDEPNSRQSSMLKVEPKFT
jgi:hypothetical protein